MLHVNNEDAKEDADKLPQSAADAKPLKDRKNRKDKVKPLAKVIIRRLPPTMTEENFTQQIAPIPDHDYFYFVPADWSLGQNASCRAYINFCNQDDIFIFKDRFDGYVFVDSKGAEYPAVVEFAPFQGLPKNKSRKKDSKSNTIETEPHFLSFLESLKAVDGEGKGEMKMEYSFQIKDDQKVTSTPLLEYIANLKQERRDERKRKIEDRKRQREEEKQRKRNQVAKAIPKAIAEEGSKEDDDGIIVRTIKSRPLDRDRDRDRDRNKKDHPSDGPKEDRDRGKRLDSHNDRRQGDRDKKETLRRDETQKKKENRVAKRQEERQRNRRDRDEKPGVSTHDQRNKALSDGGSSSKQLIGKDEKDKVKKYSETRKERKARGENKVPEKEEKDVQDKKVEKISDKQNEKSETKAAEGASTNSKSTHEESKTKSVDGDSSVKDKVKQDRSARVIRNKDRPSLQIYQPGKRRQGGSGTGDQRGQRSEDGDRPLSKSSSTSTSPIMDDPPQKQDRGKTSDSARKASENQKSTDKSSTKYGGQRRSSVKSDDSVKGTAKNNKNPVDKKVSRYSERRNRAKEKREAVEVEDGVGKLSLNHPDKGGQNDKEATVPKSSWSEGDDRPFCAPVD